MTTNNYPTRNNNKRTNGYANGYSNIYPNKYPNRYSKKNLKKLTKAEKVGMFFFDKRYRDMTLEKPLAWIVFILLTFIALIQ